MARQISWRGVLSPDGPGDGRPEAQRLWRPGTPVVPPRSIVDSVRLMQFGAVLEVAELLRGLLTHGQLRTAIVNQAAHDHLVATNANIDGLVRLYLTITTATAVVAIALWLSMAKVTVRGSRSGRIVASILYALAVLGFVGGLLPTAGLFAQTFALALLAVGAWALIRLWHRDSTAYIKYQTRPQD